MKTHMFEHSPHSMDAEVLGERDLPKHAETHKRMKKADEHRRGKGTNHEDTKLNEAQGHEVSIKR